MLIETLQQADLGFTSSPPGVFKPLEVFREQVSSHARKIENCWWFRPVRIDFDLPEGLPQDSLQRELLDKLSDSIEVQGHPGTGIASEKSDLIFGFHDVLSGEETLFDRVQEIDPIVMQAKKRDGIDTLSKNYTLVITIDEDVISMSKRESEKITRMLMARLGALKILMIKSGNDGTADYYALGTMEGGLAIEDAKKEGAIDRLRDRLVTHACAKESGGFEKVENAILANDWVRYGIADDIAHTSRTLASWGYISKPFDLTEVCSRERVRYIQTLMGYSRQSESAIAAHAYNLIPPQTYQMGDKSGVIISSKSGRFNIDKTKLHRGDTIPVAIVPNPDYKPEEGDPLNLYGFQRFSLGIEGMPIVGPSIEFDEMAAAMIYSGSVRVRRHENGRGFRIDPDGDIVLPRVRGFVHLHQGLNEVDLSQRIGGGFITADLFAYIPPNLDDYPYPVGCGKDIMFALSTDAARRLESIAPVGSGKQVAAFDAMDHGTNFLLLTEPLPGTEYIHDNPFYSMLMLVNPDTGSIKMTDEIAQV